MIEFYANRRLERTVSMMLFLNNAKQLDLHRFFNLLLGSSA